MKSTSGTSDIEQMQRLAGLVQLVNRIKLRFDSSAIKTISADSLEKTHLTHFLLANHAESN